MSNNSKEENYKKEIRKKITLPTKGPTRPSKNKEYNYIPLANIDVGTGMKAFKGFV